MGSCQRGHVRRGDGQYPSLPHSAYRGLQERHGGAEGVKVDVVERPLGEQHMHVLVGCLAVGQVVELDVALDPRHRCGGDVVGHHLGTGDLVCYADGSGSGGRHCVSDGYGIAAEGSEEHDADVAVERHLFVEEHGADLLAGAVGGMLKGNADVCRSLADDGAFGAQTFSPLIRRTILYGSRLRLVGVTSSMRTSSLLLMSCSRGFLDFL